MGLTGKWAFLNDIKPRNVGYKNGKFYIFDPAKFDKGNIALSAITGVGVYEGSSVIIQEIIQD